MTEVPSAAVFDSARQGARLVLQPLYRQWEESIQARAMIGSDDKEAQAGHTEGLKKIAQDMADALVGSFATHTLDTDALLEFVDFFRKNYQLFTQALAHAGKDVETYLGVLGNDTKASETDRGLAKGYRNQINRVIEGPSYDEKRRFARQVSADDQEQPPAAANG